jgi:hypothetical protein
MSSRRRIPVLKSKAGKKEKERRTTVISGGSHDFPKSVPEMSRRPTAPRLRRVVKTASKGKDKDKLGSKQGFLVDNGNKNVAGFFGNGYWTPILAWIS